MGEEESAASYGRVVEDVVKTNGYGQHHSGVFVDLEAPATTHQSNKEDSAAGGVVSNISSVERSSEEESDDQITPSASSCDHKHYSHRSPWLRAMVLGANDGLISIASLMLGVGAVNNDVKSMIVSGLAGLVAGACSMAIGEFVSVFSQRDSELADVEKERQEHMKGPEAQARELEELTQIYVGRGLSYSLAKQVAEELTKGDPIRAHARDELGIDMDELSNPMQAAVASAVAFSLGAAIPLLAGSFIINKNYRMISIVATSSLALSSFGALGAKLGGAGMVKAALRVLIGGWIAMLITYGVLRLCDLIGV
jgi:VIT1/CCC1 family predicted Fe2+/Mn2+ transporter